jgi:hypothetical protein
MSKYHPDKGQSKIGYGVLAIALLAGTGCERAQAGTHEEEVPAPAAHASAGGESVVDWNTTAFDVAGRADGFKDPFVHLRALTTMHLAMHDAVNGVSSKYGRYALKESNSGASPVVAAAAAAHGVLIAAYPSQRALLDQKLGELTAGERDSAAKERGIALGKEAARAVLASRARDGSDAPDRYTPAPGPGRYQFVPPFDLVYRPAWRNVKPFGLTTGDQFRSKPPPALGSAQYAASYDEVKSYGRATEANRTADQTFYADWWYELSEIGWNRIARVTWPAQPKRDLWFTARLFALLNVGLMDAYIAGWDSKLHYDFWRPYTAIRQGAADNNAATAPEANWQPYCVTPPVQDYPSTHSALGAAGAAILHGVYGRDVPFTMESTSSKPPGQKRSFTSFQRAAIENADSRVACGIHFRFATRAGLELGKQVGEHVLKAALPPLSPSS